MGLFDSLTGSDALAMFDTESVTITRDVPAPQYGSFTQTTVYTGNGDLQISSGGTYINADGAVDQVDAILTIDPAADGSLPTVESNDVVTCSSNSYNVVNVVAYTFPVPHLELMLKSGGLAYKPESHP